MFARLGSWCFRKRRRVAVLWVLAVLVVGGISSGIGGNFGQDFEPPGFESTRGLDVLENEFDDQVGSGTQGTIVFRAEQGVDDPAVQESMEQLFTMVQTIADDPDVDVASDPAFAHLDDDALQVLEDADLSTWEGITLASPYDDPTGRQISSQGDNAGLIAYANLEIPGDDWEEAGTIGRTLEQVLPTVDGVQVELGGAALGEFEEPSTEALGLAFAIVILVLAFGSVLAMGLPVGVALAGIFAGSVIVTILSNLLVMPDFAPFLGGMIGLGVGIDYALFIVTRYRENLHHGHTPEEATSIAIDTAGRAVAFAGVTVVVSFLGMVVMGISFIQGLAVSAAVVVAMTVVASLTLLPALLGFAGHRVEVTRLRGVVATGFLVLGLIGAGLKIDPLAGLRAPVRRAHGPGRVRGAAAEARGAPAPAEADPRDPGVPVEPLRAAPSLAGRHHRCGRAARALDPRARAAARVLRREQLLRGHHHPPGLRPAGGRVRTGVQRPVPPRGTGRRPRRP